MRLVWLGPKLNTTGLSDMSRQYTTIGIDTDNGTQKHTFFCMLFRFLHKHLDGMITTVLTGLRLKLTANVPE